MNYRIGVLRHERNGHAEEQIISVGEARNIEIVLIDPFTITIGVQPDSIRNHGKILSCDGIISRCEISSCLAPECEAYLRLLQFYENRQIPIINSAETILRCQDKFRTHYYLSQCGVPTPKTFVTYEIESAKKLLRSGELEFPVIVKKIYGSRGDGVHRIDDFYELENLSKNHFVAGEVLLLQEFLDLEVNSEGEVKDFRVWAFREKTSGKARAMGAVYRNARNGNFRTNTLHGGYVSPVIETPGDVLKLAETALDAVSADVAGIDVARTKDGKLYVEEINISFETGIKSQNFIGNIWAEVIEMLLWKIEHQYPKSSVAGNAV